MSLNILMAFLQNDVWILKEEVLFYSLLGVKGLTRDIPQEYCSISNLRECSHFSVSLLTKST